MKHHLGPSIQIWTSFVKSNYNLYKSITTLVLKSGEKENEKKVKEKFSFIWLLLLYIQNSLEWMRVRLSFFILVERGKSNVFITELFLLSSKERKNGLPCLTRFEITKWNVSFKRDEISFYFISAIFYFFDRGDINEKMDEHSWLNVTVQIHFIF
jgi:hypothetical protein